MRIELGRRTDGIHQTAWTAHTGYSQIVLGGDTGIARTLDHPAAGSRRWRRLAAVDGRFGTVDWTRFGRQVEIRFRRGSVRQSRRHREEEIIRKVFIQLTDKRKRPNNRADKVTKRLENT